MAKRLAVLTMKIFIEDHCVTHIWRSPLGRPCVRWLSRSCVGEKHAVDYERFYYFIVELNFKLSLIEALNRRPEVPARNQGGKRRSSREAPVRMIRGEYSNFREMHRMQRESVWEINNGFSSKRDSLRDERSRWDCKWTARLWSYSKLN